METTTHMPAASTAGAAATATVAMELKPFKVKDVTRNIKKAVCASTLEDIRLKVAEKFNKSEQLPTIHLDSDGTEIDDEEYFRTLDENTELIAVFSGEHWIDPTHYLTISHRNENGDTTDAVKESARIKQLVGQLQNNLCNVSVMNDADLDSLSNMDPNSLVDITGKEFMEQLKDSGRPFCAKRNAQDRINLLKLLKAGAIFCSERYPEDAEDIDMEINKSLNAECNVTNTKPFAAATTTQLATEENATTFKDAESNVTGTLVSNHIVTVTVTDADNKTISVEDVATTTASAATNNADI